MIELNGLRGEVVGEPKLWLGQRERNGQIQKAEETGPEGRVYRGDESEWGARQTPELLA